MPRLWVALTALALLTGFPTSVLAGTASPGASTAGAPLSVTPVATSCLFFKQTTPGNYTCIVPTGVTSLNYQVRGADGGPGEGHSPATPGGKGAQIEGTLSVTPGESLHITVGANGAGYGTSTYHAGAGGGYSSVATSSDVPLVVAGGGGGAGETYPFNADGSYPDGKGGNGGIAATSPNSGGAGGNGHWDPQYRQDGADGGAVTVNTTVLSGGAAGGGGGGAGGTYDLDPATDVANGGTCTYQYAAGGGGAFGGISGHSCRLTTSTWVPVVPFGAGYGAGGEGALGGGGGGGYAGGGGGGNGYAGQSTEAGGGGGGGASLIPEGANASIATGSPHVRIWPTAATLYVIPNDKTIDAGSAAPGAVFYTFTITDTDGAPVMTSGLESYTAPTCSSGYTTTTPRGAIEISCGGGTNYGTAASATGVTFDYTATATLTVLAVSDCQRISGNLVTNCGFETYTTDNSSLAHWTGWADSSATAWSYMAAYGAPHSGAFAVQAGPTGGTNWIEQDLSTTAGAHYLLEFYFRSGADTGSTTATFTATVDGTTAYSRSNTDTVITAWTLVEYAFTAADSSTTLRFTFQNEPDYWYLDDVSVVLDTTAPTLTLEQAAGQADPTSTSPVNFRLVADEILDGTTVTAADFSVTNGTIGIIACTGSPTTCTIPVTPTADGAVTIAPATSPDFSIADPAGNAQTSAGGTDRSITYSAVPSDTTPPTLTLAQAGAQADPTSTSPVNFSLVADEVLDGTTVTAADFSVTNGTIGIIACTGSPTTCTIPVTPTAAGAVTIAPSVSFSIADLAGNAQTSAGGADRSITYDATAPTLTLAQAGAQADPTSTSPVNFSLVADEVLDGTTVTAADFTITNGTIGTIDCTGSPTTCTIPLTPTAAGAVTIAPSVSFSIADLAGNAQTSAGGADRSITYDATAPTLTLAQAGAQADPTSTSPVNFSLVADEVLDGTTVTAADFSVTNGTIGIIACTGSPTTCTIPVTPTAAGAVTIAPSVSFSIADLAGNAQTSAGGADRSITYAAGPTVMGSAKVQGSRVTVTFTVTGQTSYACTLNDVTVMSCTSPWTNPLLKAGTYHFEITAINSYGTTVKDVTFTIKSGKVKS